MDGMQNTSAKQVARTSTSRSLRFILCISIICFGLLPLNALEVPSSGFAISPAIPKWHTHLTELNASQLPSKKTLKFNELQRNMGEEMLNSVSNEQGGYEIQDI
jgi:hypothetical protein